MPSINFWCAIAALGLAALALPVGAQAPKCRPADQNSADLITSLKNWVTTTDPERKWDRDNTYKVPVVPVSQISLVTDERVCAKVIQAYGALPGGHVPASLYVVKLGSMHFAVSDPNDLAGDMRIVLIMDSKFNVVGGWTGA